MIVPTVVISVPTNLLAAILPANCALVIPAVLDKLLVVNPVAEIVPALIEIPEPAVNAVCFSLNVVQYGNFKIVEQIKLERLVGIFIPLNKNYNGV